MAPQDGIRLATVSLLLAGSAVAALQAQTSLPADETSQDLVAGGIQAVAIAALRLPLAGGVGIKPQKGILYFVVGSGGQLRTGNIDRSIGITAAGLDTDNSFLVGEFLGDQFTFQAVARSGQIVDSGTFTRRRE